MTTQELREGRSDPRTLQPTVLIEQRSAADPPVEGAGAPTRTMRQHAVELAALKQAVELGDERATARQRERGKLTARERIAALLDEDSFHEIDALRRHRSTLFNMDENRPHTDGVVAGWGTVHGRTVFVYAHDFRIFGGALGEAHAQKICKVMDLALAAGAPVVAVSDGAGARIQEGVAALAGYGGIFRRNCAASGVIPQISVVVGPCAGGAAYSPALTDFVFMVRGLGQMYVTGPDVVHAVTGEQVTHEALGGSMAHSRTSGVAHFEYTEEAECLEEVRFLLSLLPSDSRARPEPAVPAEPAPGVGEVDEELAELVPTEPNRPYDVRRVIARLVDGGEFLEVHEHWARNAVCALARIDGATVGIVANQPMHLAGALDLRASEKAARFVTFCDAFNIPIVTLVDVPGFLPGVDQEHSGIIRHGAKLLYAYCNATVPRISVVLRKAYGGAYIVMDSRSIGADLSYAWPTNEIAVMGSRGAASVIFRRRIAAAPDPEAERARLAAQYESELMHPYHAAELGLVDDVIDPRQTRRVLKGALAMLREKNADLPIRKHGNPPQ